LPPTGVKKTPEPEGSGHRRSLGFPGADVQWSGVSAAATPRASQSWKTRGSDFKWVYVAGLNLSLTSEIEPSQNINLSQHADPQSGTV
jgi:hypothetical protein